MLKENEVMKNEKDILSILHKHYHYSKGTVSTRYAESLAERIIKLTRLSGTRWMPQISKAFQTLLASYRVLVAHFQHIGEAQQATAEVQCRAMHLYRKLKSFPLRFMMFLADLLDIVKILTFQQDDITASKMLGALEMANLLLFELPAAPNTLSI